MRRALIFTAIGMAAGLGMAALFDRAALPERSAAGRSPWPGASAADGLGERVASLEAALAAETRQRAALQEAVRTLQRRIATPGADRGEAAPPAAGGLAEPVPAGNAAPADDFRSRRAEGRERASPGYRRDRLIEAGFSADRAQWILERENRMRMDMLNAQYRARREGEPYNQVEERLAGLAQLRAELGDDGYVRYLKAMGRPTTVEVREVIDSSPAQAAGLESGDEIVSYGGQRVFNIAELNRLTLEGEPGELVALDILRDGQPMQLYLSRGPIGFAAGGRGLAIGPRSFLP